MTVALGTGAGGSQARPFRSGIWAAAALLAVAPALSPAFEPQAPAKQAEARKKAAAGAGGQGQRDGAAKARELFSALRELNEAVRDDQKPAGKRASRGDAPAPRPKKTVTPPTLTSDELDRLIDNFLRETKAPPATATSDVEFVRRVFLDVTGKIPTPEQTRAFVSTREKDKRAKLIEYLLNSPDYASNWARYWRDVIAYRATNQQFARIGFNDLDEWLEEQIAKNRPWDEVATELITASGRQDENGAVVFSLAHEAQPAEVAGEVSRVFLGVQIACAQCHDHPTDSWKREQFHGFASFFAGARARRATPPGGGPQVFQVLHQGRPRYTMPDLKDPQKPIPVAPKFFLDEKAEALSPNLSAEERHALAASYVTGQDNPWFARAFVNRVWYALTGDAFYTPLDDLGPDREAKAPEVLEALASQWQAGGYDVKWLLRTVLNSKAYQRQSRSTMSASGRTPLAANCPSRLRADQIFDALAQALNLPLDGSGPLAGRMGAMAKKGANKALQDAAGKTKGMARGGGPRALFNLVFGVDPSVSSEDVLGTIPQALFLMNSPIINNGVAARPNAVLGQILASTPDNREALNALYLRVLSRAPTPKEVATCGRYVEAVGNRREAFEDIFWALINSTEFITRR